MGQPRLRLAFADLNLYHEINRIRRLMQKSSIYHVMSQCFNNSTSKPNQTFNKKLMPGVLTSLI